MKKFDEPIVEIVNFDVEDVVTASEGGVEIPSMIGPCV